jgi:hypothetical protein
MKVILMNMRGISGKDPDEAVSTLKPPKDTHVDGSQFPYSPFMWIQRFIHLSKVEPFPAYIQIEQAINLLFRVSSAPT